MCLEFKLLYPKELNEWLIKVWHGLCVGLSIRCAVSVVLDKALSVISLFSVSGISNLLFIADELKEELICVPKLLILIQWDFSKCSKEEICCF